RVLSEGGTSATPTGPPIGTSTGGVVARSRGFPVDPGAVPPAGRIVPVSGVDVEPAFAAEATDGDEEITSAAAIDERAARIGCGDAGWLWLLLMVCTRPAIPVMVVAELGATAPAIAMPYWFQFCWLVRPEAGEPMLLPSDLGTTKSAFC